MLAHKAWENRQNRPHFDLLCRGVRLRFLTSDLLAPTGVWRSPPSPIVIGGPFPQAKPLPSRPLLPSSPPPLLGSFCKAPGGGGPGWWGGGVLGARGWRGGGPPSAWGQTHVWGYSILAGSSGLSKSCLSNSFGEAFLRADAQGQRGDPRVTKTTHRTCVS